MIKKVWTVDLQEDPITSDIILEFPAEVLEQAGWREGDSLIWKDNGDGSFMLTKQETEWVLVETVSQFRQRYMVEVPKGKSEYALDTVGMEEAKEFSQAHLGETIVSHRVISKENALELCDNDNDYALDWGRELKIQNFFTRVGEKNNDQ
jgi:bifunctional DNA-binding transcriptional regulator/antitoxin component of YhaV-PrlF toxin-antitoxin module